MQMQCMQMRMKLSLKHNTRYAQHFAMVNSESCQVSEVELFAKTVNDLKPLKVITLLVKIPSVKNFVSNKYLSPRQKFVTFYRQNFLPGYI